MPRHAKLDAEQRVQCARLFLLGVSCKELCEKYTASEITVMRAVAEGQQQAICEAAQADERDRKESAMNLMLTCPHPVVRKLAERYMEGTKNLGEFLAYLREHPIPEIDEREAKAEEKMPWE